MRHHPEHVALVAENACDGIGRTIVVPIRIETAVGGSVAEQHPALALEPRDGLLVGDVVALAMRDRHADDLARIITARERRIGALDSQTNLVTDELERGIAHQHAWQQPGLAENLEAIANAEHKAATLGMFTHRIHN